MKIVRNSNYILALSVSLLTSNTCFSLTPKALPSTLSTLLNTYVSNEQHIEYIDKLISMKNIAKTISKQCDPFLNVNIDEIPQAVCAYCESFKNDTRSSEALEVPAEYETYKLALDAKNFFTTKKEELKSHQEDTKKIITMFEMVKGVYPSVISETIKTLEDEQGKKSLILDLLQNPLKDNESLDMRIFSISDLKKVCEEIIYCGDLIVNSLDSTTRKAFNNWKRNHKPSNS